MRQKWGLALPDSYAFSLAPDAPSAQRFSGSTDTDGDFRNRTPRPWGGGDSVGALEYPDLSQDTGSQITGGGTNSLKITGAGEVSFHIPVDAASTTITIKTKSSSYGGTNYPQLIVTANPSIGVSQQTATASDATEQTLTAGPFTPTAAGVVEVRLIARSTSTTSGTFFDMLATG
jgi:hypothetical protein